MGHAKDGFFFFFFCRNSKSRSLAFRKILFYQNIICFDWVMNLFLSWVMFSVKKVSFPAKTAVHLGQCNKPKTSVMLSGFWPLRGCEGGGLSEYIRICDENVAVAI